MKIIAILLMLLTVLMMAGYGMMFLFGFAMSFDAPGSTSDPKAWGMRLLLAAPLLIFLVCLIMSLKAYAGSNYTKSALLGAVAPIVCIVLLAIMDITSNSSMKKYNEQVAKEKEMEAKYTVEKYMRTGPLGTDTIIVWPSGIVAYRLNIEEMPNQWNGPLGILSEDRKMITYDRRPDTRLPMEELYHFMDSEGRIFTNVYGIK